MEKVINLKRLLHGFSILFLLAVFLTGSTGMTYSIHTCRSSGKSSLKFYPEVFSKYPSCCCEETEGGAIPSEEMFNEQDCCKTVNGFIKTVFTGIPLNYHFDKILSVELVYSDISLIHLNFPEPLQKIFVSIEDHSPPLSGRNLVYFLHQIRIPAPGC